MSRPALNQRFEDGEPRFLAELEDAIAELRALLWAAYSSQAGWQDGMREALAALLTAFDRRPDLASLCVIEALAAGAPTLRRRAQVLAELAVAVDRGRDEDGARAPSDITPEGVVGAVFSVLHTRLLESPREPLSDMLGPLMGMIVLPYLGPRAAHRELINSPRPMRAPERLRVVREHKPMAPTVMRLTYRTLRVLDAIAQRPGSTNREIARAAGITHEGQISALLGRIGRLELAVNNGGAASRGASNAWRLTEHGEQLLRTRHARLARAHSA